MEASLMIWNHENCNEKYGKRRGHRQGITETLLCAGDPVDGKDSCDGDSGGPIHVDTPKGRRTSARYVIGLVAFGRTCGIKTIPAVYTKVFPYLTWIEDNVWNDDIYFF